MKKIRNFLPIEFYFLLIPSALLFLVSFFYFRSLSTNVFGVGEFLEDSFSPTSPNAATLLTLIITLLLGTIFKILSYRMKKTHTDNEQKTTHRKQIFSILMIIILISFVSYSLMLFTGLLFRIANPVKTAELGNIFMSWDRTIFKTDPGIWLINHFGNTFVENALLWTYNSIFEILSIILFVSFFFNRKSFRKLVLSFFISWIIALPLWFLFPTLTPDYMFRLDKLNSAGPEEVKAFNNFKPSYQLKKDLGVEEGVHIISLSPTNKILPTSTFPSMHAAWGTVIAYAGIVLCPWLGIILVPWSILNDIGSVYILEHFSVDIFFGVFIALISILTTEALFHFENKYFEDKFGLLSGFDYVWTVFKKFIN